MTYRVFLSSIAPGCRPNCLQSAQIYHYLLSNNHQIVKDVSKADYIILNTCGFTDWYEDTSELIIKRFLKLRRTRLIAIGCLTKINRDILVKYDKIIIIDDLKELDKYFFTIAKFQERDIYSNDEMFKFLNEQLKIERIQTLSIFISLVKVINRFLKQLNLSQFPFNKILERYTGKGQFFVKIGEGCIGNCSYCVIKKAKHKIVSRSIEDILFDIKNHLDKKKENNILLVADDCGSYGIDIGTSIFELLKQIGQTFPSVRIGIEYLYPKWIEKSEDKLLNIFQEVKISDINISIQSGSQNILKLMNRNYNIERILKFITVLNKISPGTMVYTHYLLSFPGERFKDFLKTLKTIPYFHFFLPFTYSSRKGAKSSELPETVSKFMKGIQMRIALALLYMNFIRYLLKNIIKRIK